MDDHGAGTEPQWLKRALDLAARARVTVFGDFCLDAYWIIDPDESELSVETHLPVRRVREQRYGLGGAGNVVANLAALGVARVRAVGLVGQDLFGREMLGLLAELGTDAAGTLACQADWQTLVYAKPHVGDREQNRVDFGGFNAISPPSVEALAAALDAAAGDSDAVILNQQVPLGVSTEAMIERINAVIARHEDTPFLVDSRHRAALYRGGLLKINAHEAARLAGEPVPLSEAIGESRAADLARRLYERTGRAVFVTRGAAGLIVAHAGGVHVEPGIHFAEATDPVGAGDTAAAALAGVLGGGGEPVLAARLANLAAGVTVRKLRTTGTATPEEIRAAGADPDYVYEPELAGDPGRATYAGDSEIEVVRPLPEDRRIRHALFDHDGTVSTLREGWQGVMAPMMVRAILGGGGVPDAPRLIREVRQGVEDLIARTTGAQTLVQMQSLVELVRRFGRVPAEQVLDMHGYKRIYDRELMVMVRRRLEKLRRGELSAGDFQIKGVRRFLDRLRELGVRLYLASGTDHADVVAEAEALGYAGLFEGRIFGAVGDVHVEAKSLILERILGEHRLGGSGFATFGDGPVEVRQTRKRDGIAVGVASDEVRRFGLNVAKRARLIRAGADLIVPDYSQADALIAVLFPRR